MERVIYHFTNQPSAIDECIFKTCPAIGQLNGGRNSHTIPPTTVQTKPRRKQCALVEHNFSGRVTERGDSTLGRRRALPFPLGLLGVIPLERSPAPSPSHTSHNGAPSSRHWILAPPARPPHGWRSRSAHKGGAWAPPRPRSPSPARDHQVPVRAIPCPRVSAHPGSPWTRRGAGPPTAPSSHCRGLLTKGAQAGETLTFSMVPGSRRSNSLQRTTPSFKDACRKPSGSEMVFLGDSSTPKVMSHVTVCSAEFIAAARPASQLVSLPFTSERPRPGR